LKRFDLLLSILPALKAKQSSIHLVLIGDGPELPRLREQAESSGLTSSVTFTGELPDAGRYLKAFDLFCLPSTSEGMPNVILEAAAAGLPIVTWDLPFYQEILDNGKTGLLVEAGNVEKLEEAVTRLIESPQLRAQLGVEAQARILREFSLERYIRSMTAAYDELLNNPPAGASGNP
jgi:glycosyltransferase involved in cell wall biosynthesis